MWLPLFAVLSGYLILGETLKLQEIIGGLVTVTGVGIIMMRKIQKQQPSR